MMLFLLITILVVLLYVYLKKKVAYWDEAGVKNSKPHFILGSFLKVFKKQLAISDVVLNHYNEFRNKRYFGMYLLVRPILVINDPELIGKITVKNFDHFVDHNNGGHPEVDALWSKNLFALLGKEWQDLRSVLTPAFTGNKMRLMFPLLDECAESFMDFLCEKTESTLELEMKDVMSRVTNDMIATTSFGIKCDSMRDPDNEFYRIGKKAFTFEGLRRFPFFLYGTCPKLLQMLGAKIFTEEIATFFRRAITDTIKQREKLGIVRPDMIHLLLQCRKGQLEYEGGTEDESLASAPKKVINITDEDITAQALIFFFGGMDTTAFLLGFISYELALNPDIQDKLRAEVLEVLEKYNGKVTYAAVMEMNYMDMVISETLRTFPIAFILDRLCTKDYVIEAESDDEKPVVVKEGSVIWIPVVGLHQDPRYFPDPERFDPERFSKENRSKIKPFTYMPFGSGPRNCIGSRFAFLQVKTLMAHLLRRLEIVPTRKTKVPLEFCKNHSFLVCSGGLWLGFKKL